MNLRAANACKSWQQLDEDFCHGLILTSDVTSSACLITHTSPIEIRHQIKAPDCGGQALCISVYPRRTKCIFPSQEEILMLSPEAEIQLPFKVNPSTCVLDPTLLSYAWPRSINYLFFLYLQTFPLQWLPPCRLEEHSSLTNKLKNYIFLKQLNLLSLPHLLLVLPYFFSFAAKSQEPRQFPVSVATPPSLLCLSRALFLFQTLLLGRASVASWLAIQWAQVRSLYQVYV